MVSSRFTRARKARHIRQKKGKPDNDFVNYAVNLERALEQATTPVRLPEGERDWLIKDSERYALWLELECALREHKTVKLESLPAWRAYFAKDDAQTQRRRRYLRDAFKRRGIGSLSLEALTFELGGASE